jgi:hypothetical protein
VVADRGTGPRRVVTPPIAVVVSLVAGYLNQAERS